MKYEAGLTTIIDPGADRALEEIPTGQCVHCGGHFEIRPGSGKVRGFCYSCNGLICSAKCRECKPFERWLEEQEGTKNPTAVSVGMPGKLWLP